ncbi:UNVERIFIED_CONTAM: molybdopterin-dependent oxidoreductase, partial [Pseudomonas aeruginosa]
RLALAALCTALPAPGVAADASLHVYGAVQRELRLDLAALRQLPAQDSGKLAMVCQSGAQVGAEREYRGVRLSDVLDQAGLDMPGHQDAR